MQTFRICIPTSAIDISLISYFTFLRQIAIIILEFKENAAIISTEFLSSLVASADYNIKSSSS